MPRRNTIRYESAQSFYHVYARGNGKQKIFLDENDYIFFLNLLERYLSPEEHKDKFGVMYPNFFNKVDLLAYCLMPNHFHFLVYQHQQTALAILMKSIMTSYSRYFNARHQRSGQLYESRYRSSIISDESYLEHITRYIHLNPRDWREYAYSSLPYYLQRDTVEWLSPKKIIDMFSGPNEYLNFLADNEETKKMNDILKHELAG